MITKNSVIFIMLRPYVCRGKDLNLLLLVNKGPPINCDFYKVKDFKINKGSFIYFYSAVCFNGKKKVYLYSFDMLIVNFQQ